MQLPGNLSPPQAGKQVGSYIPRADSRLSPANEGLRYFVTMSLIGWVQPGLILGLRPANERWRNDVSHWLGASLESALYTTQISPKGGLNKLGKHFYFVGYF